MSRFVLFSGKGYYPRGGMNDLVGRYDTLEEAQKAFSSGVDPSGREFGQEWYQIVDLTSFEIVEELL
jgi:hypothetical protein